MVKTSQRLSFAARVTFGYLTVAGLWIVLADWLVEMPVSGRAYLLDLHEWRGITFLLITAFVLYMLLRLPALSENKDNDKLNSKITEAPVCYRSSLLILAFLVLAIAISSFGYLFYRQQNNEFKQHQYAQQSAIAELKTREIEAWLSERRQDIRFLLNNTDWRDAIDQSKRNQNRLPVSHAYSHFEDLIRTEGWSGIGLYTGIGKFLFGAGKKIVLGDATTAAIEAAVKSKTLQIIDVHTVEPLSRTLNIDFIAPIPVGRPGDPAPAVLILSIDPQGPLFQMAQAWPVPSASSEALLVHREGNDVVFINTLRHINNVPLMLRYPLTKKDLPSVQAVLLGSGYYEGPDYRGVGVLAAYRPVIGMPWYVVAKTDSDEVFLPLRRQALLIMLVVLLAIGGTALAVLLFWRSQQTAFAIYRQRQSEQRKALVNQYDKLIQLARDIYLLVESSGVIVEANQAAAASYGYSIEELRGMTILQVHAPDAQLNLTKVIEDATHSGGKLYETLHCSKDGRIFPVEISISPLEVENKPYVQAFIRDISSRRATETQNQRLIALYATIRETSRAIVHLQTIEELYVRICNIAVECGGFLAAWIGRVDERTECIKPMTSVGGINDYIQQLSISANPELSQGRQSAAIAYRTGKPYYCHDFASDPEPEAWMELGRRLGIRASAAIPLYRNGAVESVFTLYAGQTDFFDIQMRELLEEMAIDIAFALDNFDRETARKMAEANVKASEAQLQTVLRTIPDLVWLKDRHGVFLSCNPAFTSLFGVKEKDILGKRDDEWMPDLYLYWYCHLEPAVAMTGESYSYEESLAFTDYGMHARFLTTQTPVFDSNGQQIGTLGVSRDITEINRHQAMLAGSNSALEMVAKDSALTETLAYIVRDIESQSPGMLCSILLLDESGVHLRHGAAPSLPNDYCQAIDGSEIGPKVGSCGTAAFTKKPVYVYDIATDPLWADYSELALRYGLRACWSTPILSGDSTVLGTFAVYYRAPRNPTETDQQLIANATYLAAIAIEHSRNKIKLNDQLDELRRWYEATLGRETRTLELKQEINEILSGFGHPPRYNFYNPEQPAVRNDTEELRLIKEAELLAQKKLQQVLQQSDRSRLALLSVIDDLKRSEAALVHVKESLERAEENAKLGCWEWQVDTQKGYWSTQLFRIFDLEPTKQPPNFAEYLQLIHPDDRALVQEITRNMAEGKPPLDFIHRTSPDRGAIRYLCPTHACVNDSRGKIVKFTGTIQDVTDRELALEGIRQLNATLEQRVLDRTAELETANQELEAFSYSVSHDLRAPLRAITGFSQILSRRYRQFLDEEGQHYLDNVVLAGERMGVLIEDLLMYSRTGRDAVRTVPVQLAPIVGQLMETFAERIAAIQAQVEIAQPLATPVGDFTLIGQIFTNLIDNALTYCRSDCTLRIIISSVLEGDQVVVSVCDNGIGIAPEYHGKIFQVFQRLHSEDEYPGTGIGLAIIAKAVRLMGGAVSVESLLGNGSTFKVYLPAANSFPPEKRHE